MKPEDWQKIESILQEALDAPPDERAELIGRRSGGDEELRGEIERLLAREEREDSFLESPVWTDSLFLDAAAKREIALSLEEKTSAKTESSIIGSQIGVFRLVKEIGRGGMGMVYLAERADGEFRQKVAVKLIKRGMDSDFILSRFRQERQILAALDHPHIARLFDGGTTPNDSPYFVMEYVEGKSFFEFCRTKNYDLRRKLELFLPICAAIAHAHKRQIIHRDIKPTNILVTDEGAPKLLDFGIAKILDPDLIHESISPTATQMRLMTPEYASPEQVRGDAITPATDQYSLGVLLYELITGKRPYQFSSRAPHEIARIICEEEPLRPSSQISQESDDEPPTDGNSERDLTRLAEVDESLENIVLKSLRKKPSDRYESVAEFSTDIERYLNDQPVHADSLTTGENSFARRAPENSSAVPPLINSLESNEQGKPISSASVNRKADSTMPAATAKTNPDGEISTVASEAETVIQARGKASERSPSLVYVLATIIFLIVLSGAAYFIYSRSTVSFSGNAARPQDVWRNTFTSAMSVKRLTASGKEQTAAVSPDGKQVAYVSGEADAGSLWIRQIDTDTAQPLVAPGSVSYSDVIFSPDGRYVYYTTFNQTFTERLLWRIPATGGAPQKILNDVNGGITLTADGKRLAYFSYDRAAKLSSLIIAELNENGTLQSLKNVATRAQPDYFSGNPAISSDGGKVVFVVAATAADQTSSVFYALDLKSGAEEKLPAPAFSFVNAIRWRANADELVFNANTTNAEPMQLWAISYPSGETVRLTNDLNNYEGISLTRNSDALVTIKRETTSNVGIVNWESGETFINMMIDGAGRQDGIAGISWTPDNRILYVASVGDKNSIILVNSDETNSRVVNVGDAQPSNPLMTGDGRYLIFIDQKGGKSTLRRYEMATGALADVVPQSVQTPTLTADSRFVIYSAYNDEQLQTLHRVPVEGGTATQLTSVRAVSPSVSPDNRYIACYFSSEKNEGWQLGVFPIDGGAPLRIIKPADSLSLHSLLIRPFGWSADSRWLYYLNDSGTTSNIFRVTTDGTNQTEQITKFPSGIIFNFSLSPDRKRAAVARGSISSDIVSFRNSYE